MEKFNFLKFCTEQFIYDGFNYGLITYYLLLKSEECVVFWKDPLTSKMESMVYNRKEVDENIKDNCWTLL